ncbi:MAG TPA: SAM-dependent methyltransferase [Steroidobacteraceae bacterium]|nr:SAM-dependent methyltransferase [Steroidobacteraceae bacterium]
MYSCRDVVLSPEEVLHTERVGRYIAGEIAAAGGWISFERYMESALYAPGLGYYSAGAHKLGRGGDFTTAPEISRLFGACVARQCAEVLHHVGGGSILEIGAGSGRLAVDVLSRLEALGRLPAHYEILELSADLRERQRALVRDRIPHLLDRVEWLETPPAASFDGVILANEVLDALPVSRFRWHPARCEELGVEFEDGAFAWAARPAGAALTHACHALAAAGGGWEEGYVSEYCPRLGAWATAVTQALRTGAVLWVDYGLPRPQYYFPERRDGTLLCHFRQRAHGDPFLYPGLQDITAWVDFTALAEASRAAGFELVGFASQAYFLAALGIDREMQAFAGSDRNLHARLAGEARQLMLPGEMGERFKAMAWLRGIEVKLAGFALQDLRHSL